MKWLFGLFILVLASAPGDAGMVTTTLTPTCIYSYATPGPLCLGPPDSCEWGSCDDLPIPIGETLKGPLTLAREAVASGEAAATGTVDDAAPVLGSVSALASATASPEHAGVAAGAASSTANARTHAVDSAIEKAVSIAGGFQFVDPPALPPIPELPSQASAGPGSSRPGSSLVVATSNDAPEPHGARPAQGALDAEGKPQGPRDDEPLPSDLDSGRYWPSAGDAAPGVVDAPQRLGALPLLSAGITIAAGIVLALYHRLRRDALLASEARRGLIEILRARPGLSAAQLASRLEFHPTTAQYHLRALVREGWVIRREAGRSVLFFENRGRLAPEEEGLLARASLGLENLAFLGAIAQRPGIAQKDLVQKLCLAKSTVSRRAAILAEAGFVAEGPTGLSLTVRGQLALARCESSPAAVTPTCTGSSIPTSWGATAGKASSRAGSTPTS